MKHDFNGHDMDWQSSNCKRCGVYYKWTHLYECPSGRRNNRIDWLAVAPVVVVIVVVIIKLLFQ